MIQIIEAVSTNLRSIREARNLSLDQLSELTGVSKSMLRQVETGKSTPTIATIWKIANGLRLSFTSLLHKPLVEAEVVPFKSGEPLTAQEGHYRLYPLIPFDPQQSFETYYVEIDPGTAFAGEPHHGNTHEYVFVTGGKLEIAVDQKAFVINQGEFLRFPANSPHDYKCLSKSMTTGIMQISYLT